MTANELRALRHLALTMASACTGMIEILEGATPAEQGAGDGEGSTGTREAMPEKLRSAGGVPMFGRKPVEDIQAAAANAVQSGAAGTPAAD